MILEAAVIWVEGRMEWHLYERDEYLNKGVGYLQPIPIDNCGKFNDYCDGQLDKNKVNLVNLDCKVIGWVEVN